MRRIVLVFFLIFIIEGCTKTNMVTQRDLQHHRWMLIAVNNKPVETYQFNVIPTLDFGEQMFVEVHDGCRQFSAMGFLEGGVLVFQQVEFITSTCDTNNTLSESLALSDTSWVITIPGHNVFRLQSGELVLDFKLNDWR